MKREEEEKEKGIYKVRRRYIGTWLQLACCLFLQQHKPWLNSSETQSSWKTLKYKKNCSCTVSVQSKVELMGVRQYFNWIQWLKTQHWYVTLTLLNYTYHLGSSALIHPEETETYYSSKPSLRFLLRSSLSSAPFPSSCFNSLYLPWSLCLCVCVCVCVCIRDLFSPVSRGWNEKSAKKRKIK